MRNRTVGLMIIGFSLLIGVIIYIFNRALTTIVNMTCDHGPTCPMWGTIDAQTYVGIAVMALVIMVGLYFVFFAKDEKIVKKEPKKIVKEEYNDILKDLDPDEKIIMEKVIDSQGTIFQSSIVDETGLTKVKVTRILDKLEGRGLVERKRRGMTNVVILKNI